MKKLFFTLLTLCLCGATYAQTTITDDNGCTYSIIEDTETVELTSGTGASGEVVIPATVENDGATYSVVGIAQGAFYGNTSLTSVTIPYTVQYIGTNSSTSGAFRGCTGLASVTFDEDSSNASQLESIGNHAFYECSSLASIDIPALVTTLGDDVFMGCSALTSIELPEKVTSLGGSLFRNCTALKEAKLPESLTVINGDCFRACTALTTVWMSGSATISSNVFTNCPSLSAFVLRGSEPAATGGSETGSDPFLNDENDIITLYVPTGSAPAYLQTNWVTDMNNDSETLQWNFLEYTNGISENAGDGNGTYYATYYTDAVGEFGDDVTPCIVTGEEDGYVQYSSISGYIPAETGVLLVASTPGDTYYYHPYGVTASSEGIADVSGNLLYGNLEDAETTQPAESGYYYYKLSRDSSGTANSVGFYWGAEGGAAFTNPAGKAYLSLPSTSGTSLSGISLKKDEEDTTGISSIESASEKAVSGIYTIQGVRVSNMNQPGLYIVDGKKVLVK